MAQKTPAKTGSTPSILKGKARPVIAVILTKAGTWVFAVVASIVIAFFGAVRIVPTIMAFVKSGSGVEMTMPTETILAQWIAPSVFLIALLFVLALVAIRAIWRLRRRVVEYVSAWALGREEAVAEVAPVAAKKTTVRAARASKAA